PRAALFPYTTLFRSIEVRILPSSRIEETLYAPPIKIHFESVAELDNILTSGLKALLQEVVPQDEQVEEDYDFEEIEEEFYPVEIDRKSTRLNSSHVK